jgi:hypothetical protein
MFYYLFLLFYRITFIGWVSELCIAPWIPEGFNPGLFISYNETAALHVKKNLFRPNCVRILLLTSPDCIRSLSAIDSSFYKKNIIFIIILFHIIYYCFHNDLLYKLFI